MSSKFMEIPIFDILKGEDGVFLGFGDLLKETDKAEEILTGEINRSLPRFSEFAGANLDNCEDIPKILEDYILIVWKDGWDPEKNNLAFFAGEFGLILTHAIHNTLGGQLIYRSETELNYLSIWWPEKQLEVFPFLHMKKRLWNKEGVNVEYFYNVVKGLVTGELG